MSRRRTSVPLCLLTALLATNAEAQTSWNRKIEAVAVVPSPGTGHHEVRVLWTAAIGPTSAPLDLSTEVAVRVGNKVYTDKVKLAVNPGAIGCSGAGCGPSSCGTGAVNGMAAALLCLPEGQLGCACEFPPLTSKFPIDLQPGDDIFVQLLPATGGLPEFDPSGDLNSTKFTGKAVFWDREIVAVSKTPTSSAGGDVFDVRVDVRIINAGVATGYDITPGITIEHHDGAGVVAVYNPPCGPWLLAPNQICGPGVCDETCAVITCNGQVQQVLRCESYENAWGLQGCTCMSPPVVCFIPGVKIKAGDQLVVKLSAAAGALPDLAELADASVPLCSASASSSTYGTGKKGTHGTPSLTAKGLPVLGAPSGILLKNGLQGALPILFLGLKSTALPFDGGLLLVQPLVVSTLPIPIAADGTLTLESTLPADAALCGIATYAQVMFVDPGADGFYKLAMSNGLERVFGS